MHGFGRGEWGFPPPAGSVYTFVISLSTLVFAQATSSYKGPKGSGETYPAPSDLVVHGGVLALERVQQLVWTLVAGVGFVTIVWHTYSTAAKLPDIPSEFLALVGISSAGYLGGIAARKSGPVVDKVVINTGAAAGAAAAVNPTLTIHGQYISVKPHVSYRPSP